MIRIAGRRWAPDFTCMAGLIAAAALPAAPASPPAQPDLAARFRDGVAVLASDDMEGRGLTTQGIRRAADWIEGEMKAMGLRPAFEGSYRQAFEVKTGVTLAEGNRLEGVDDDDWTPMGPSSSSAFSGDLVFAGYGIEAPSIGYRELEGLDLAGKIVLMLRYEPQERDDASPFDGKRPSRWSALRYKAMQARERGAAAVVFATGPHQDEGTDRLPALKNDGPESPLGIAAIQVKTSVAQRWLAPAGIDLAAFQNAVDRDLTPRSRQDTGVRVAGRVALDVAWTKAENLAGVIPGRGPLAGEHLVIGAHYDHLGLGGEGSMTPNVTAIHNGADDNASGTVAALLIARLLMQRLTSAASHRGAVIALFSGEEVGLAGSSRFVEKPPLPLERNVAMINLDMVGRLRQDKLIALGSDSALEWNDRIERAAGQVAGLAVTGHGDGYGPSDQTSFYAAGVPVLHLFTGSHDVYHTPEDDAATVDADGGARVALFAAALAEALALEPSRPTYARAAGGSSMSGDSRGYGAYLGTVPDYSAMESAEGGVLLSDVRAGGPAELAGIRGGDRIVAMAGTRIQNLYDMTFALQDHRPGDTIDVAVIRAGATVSMRATLGDRASMARQTTPQVAAAPAGPASIGPASAGGGPHGGGAGTAAAAPAPQAVSPTAATAPAHSGPTQSASPSEEKAGGIDPFYQGRPGDRFAIGAGQPYPRAFEGERHLADVRRLTFGGQSAGARFSPDGRALIVQIAAPEECGQQHTLELATGAWAKVSSGEGSATGGTYDWPEQDRIVFSSTAGAVAGCAEPTGSARGDLRALDPTSDLYQARLDGSSPSPLAQSPGFDGQAAWCHRGGRMVFTSMRDGDPDLYVMEEDGHVTRLAGEVGYDGEASYSPDCSQVAWAAGRPPSDELEGYRRLLSKGSVSPSRLNIQVGGAGGSNARRLTDNGAINFCPSFAADGKRIIYASNAGPSEPADFDLWMVDTSGGSPVRITMAPGFDAFPQFSPDGAWLAWTSSRANPAKGGTDIYIARWVE